ncbi:hypothetical protein AYI70_g7126 [Smittium culicis]|uniref:Uncharacterized protein n=1 Tax=Smittium culicis TaxID=133412 RepID=A0A1R1XM02_9FUNG|nr:hypothetical protein AYI70_g7126 [Smittium culicis]
MAACLQLSYIELIPNYFTKDKCRECNRYDNYTRSIISNMVYEHTENDEEDYDKNRSNGSSAGPKEREVSDGEEPGVEITSMGRKRKRVIQEGASEETAEFIFNSRMAKK